MCKSVSFAHRSGLHSLETVQAGRLGHRKDTEWQTDHRAESLTVFLMPDRGNVRGPVWSHVVVLSCCENKRSVYEL